MSSWKDGVETHVRHHIRNRNRGRAFL